MPAADPVPRKPIRVNFGAGWPKSAIGAANAAEAATISTARRLVTKSLRGLTPILEPRVHPNGDRIARDELHAIDVLVDRKLQEAIPLDRAAEGIAHAWADEKELAAGVLRLRFEALVACLEEVVRLQQQADPVAPCVTRARIHHDSVAGAIVVVFVQGQLRERL